MKPDPTAFVGAPSAAPANAVEAGRAAPLRKPWLLRATWVVLGVLVVGSAAGAGWWWLHQPSRVPRVPPLPENIDNPQLLVHIEDARHKVQEKPDSADAWSDLGLLLLAHKCNAEADVCFAEASRLDPCSPHWNYYRYVAALRLNPDPAQLLGFLRQANVHGESLPEDFRLALRLRLAEMLLEREELAEAESVYRAERQRHPDSKRIALGLGHLAFRRGEQRKALELLTPLQDSPSARQVTQLLAILSRQLNDHAAADQFEQKLANLGPDNDWPDPFYKMLDDYQLPEFKARELVPRLEKQGAYREAAEICVSQLKDGPKFSAYMGAGVNFVRAGDFERGLSLLRAAQGLEPDNSYTEFRIAEALFLWGNAERKRAADSAEAVKHWREAVVSARRALQLKTNHGPASLILGQALLKLGEPLAAVEALQRGAEFRPELFQMQYQLGLAYLEAASWYRPYLYREAAIHLEYARKLNPTDPQPGKDLERLPWKVGP
jgi:cytochrome c-type biogenesis protein CcmH/NrfG